MLALTSARRFADSEAWHELPNAVQEPLQDAAGPSQAAARVPAPQRLLQLQRDFTHLHAQGSRLVAKCMSKKGKALEDLMQLDALFKELRDSAGSADPAFIWVRRPAPLPTALNNSCIGKSAVSAIWSRRVLGFPSHRHVTCDQHLPVQVTVLLGSEGLKWEGQVQRNYSICRLFAELPATMRNLIRRLPCGGDRISFRLLPPSGAGALAEAARAALPTWKRSRADELHAILRKHRGAAGRPRLDFEVLCNGAAADFLPLLQADNQVRGELSSG